jgi:hypothetical protein
MEGEKFELTHTYCGMPMMNDQSPEGSIAAAAF